MSAKAGNKPSLTAREMELLAYALQCSKDPNGIQIDYEKFAELGGFKTKNSANTSWLCIKKKLLHNNNAAESSAKSDKPEDDASPAKSKAVPKKPTTKSKMKAEAEVDATAHDEKTPITSPKKTGRAKRKAVDIASYDEADSNDEANDEKSDDEGPSPKKKGGAKRKAAEAPVDYDEEAPTTSPKKKGNAQGKATTVEAADKVTPAGGFISYDGANDEEPIEEDPIDEELTDGELTDEESADEAPSPKQKRGKKGKAAAKKQRSTKRKAKIVKQKGAKDAEATDDESNDKAFLPKQKGGKKRKAAGKKKRVTKRKAVDEESTDEEPSLKQTGNQKRKAAGKEKGIAKHKTLADRSIRKLVTDADPALKSLAFFDNSSSSSDAEDPPSNKEEADAKHMATLMAIAEKEAAYDLEKEKAAFDPYRTDTDASDSQASLPEVLKLKRRKRNRKGRKAYVNEVYGEINIEKSPDEEDCKNAYENYSMIDKRNPPLRWEMPETDSEEEREAWANFKIHGMSECHPSNTVGGNLNCPTNLKWDDDDPLAPQFDPHEPEAVRWVRKWFPTQIGVGAQTYMPGGSGKPVNRKRYQFDEKGWKASQPKPWWVGEKTGVWVTPPGPRREKKEKEARAKAEKAKAEAGKPMGGGARVEFGGGDW